MAKSKAATKAASKSKSAKRPAANPRTGTEDTAGVGTNAHPGNKRIPAAAIIQRNPSLETGTKITASPEVQGDKTLMVIDITDSRPVQVFLLEGKPLTKEEDGRLIFVQGPVANDIMPVAAARSKFAVKKDGTAIYNARGFDEVSAGADFDLLDIAKLIEHNQK